jgi:two-component system, cell cycle response regulator DivK
MLTEPHPGFDVAPLALIVDRDDDSRILYTEFLELNQWRVIAAAGGPEALAKAISERPDVVVSETRLPGFDGVILSELLQRDCSTAHIPIVFVSSDAASANLARAAAAGAQAVLTKPCMPEALLEAMEGVLERSRDLRLQSTAAQATAQTRFARARAVIERVERQRAAGTSLKKALQRGDTVVPPTAPPTLTCPNCDKPLRYLRSHLGGVSVKHREQWDYFECQRRCGTFEYRTRTRKLKRVMD